jgi:membrane-associated phospholipid phosphatase
MHGTHPRTRLRDTWLLGKREVLTLIGFYLLFTGVWFAIGWSLKHPLAHSSIVRTDQHISKWFVPHRTPRLNSLTYVGSMMSDTVVKIVITALVALLVLIIFKRWLEPLVIVVPLVIEASCFITVTTLVGRPRPDVPRLETSPVGSSFPSGHVAAAIVYSAIIIVVFWHTRRVWIRAIAVAVGVIVPICVALSRIYRGMHYFTDVVFGALLGGACVIVCTLVLLRAEERRHLPMPADEIEPHHRVPVGTGIR